MKPRHEWVRALSFGALVASMSCASPPARDDAGAKDPPPPAAQSTPVAAELPKAPGGGIIVQKNVMVPMRDGVRLATDIYRPAGPGPYPVVLIRTPYGSETPGFTAKGQYYVERGYALAVQDTRGKYDSEGEWYGRRDEGKDGSDAITWLGTQPWSSGNVGMTGGSYLGMVQYWVADQDNPYLKALVPIVAPVTLGRDTADFDRIAIYSGRESFHSNVGWMLLTDGRVNQADGQGDVPGLLFGKARAHPTLADYPRIFGRPMHWWPFLLNQRYGFWEEYYHRAAQGEWSKPIDLAGWWRSYPERYRKVKVPMLHISGWYDCCGEPLIKMFQLIRQHATEPVAKDNQKLIMGPWYHGVGTSKVGEFEFGPLATMNPDSISVWWFDRWLKGQENGAERSAAVRVFVMGENRWREATDWPIPGTEFTKFYLHSKGEAHLAKGGGGLSTEPPADEPVDRYTYDPGDPTPETLTPEKRWETGPVKRTAIENRDDVLVYTTDALADAVEIAGPVSAVIYLSTSAPSTDLMVRVVDVHPNGAPYPVFSTFTDPYRTHWAKEVLEGPEGLRIYKADIVLPPTAVAFRKGHRIRVEISSASAPTYRGINVDPGTEAEATRWNVAEQTIYHDQSHPSHVVLPVIPR